MSPRTVRWISHRGESLIAPENTVASHRVARELNTDGSECDVYLTSDGSIIVCHNATTGMVADRNLTVQESTFEELRSLKVANHNPLYQNERLATLRELIAELGPDRELYLELKAENLALVPAVAKEVVECGLGPDRCVFISFSPTLIRAIKDALPAYRTLFLTFFSKHRTPAEMVATLKALHADGADVYAEELPNVREYIRALHDAGMFVAVWTIDHPGYARRFVEYGVDSITSNCAADLKKLLN